MVYIEMVRYCSSKPIQIFCRVILSAILHLILFSLWSAIRLYEYFPRLSSSLAFISHSRKRLHFKYAMLLKGQSQRQTVVCIVKYEMHLYDLDFVSTVLVLFIQEILYVQYT